MHPIYNIAFTRLVLLMMPVFLRPTLLASLLRAMVAPISSLHGLLVVFLQREQRGLAYNGQICYLEQMLNDSFDPSQRRIRIDDPNSFPRTYIYTATEVEAEAETPIYLPKRGENGFDTTYLYREDDFADAGYDFKVVLNGVQLNAEQQLELKLSLNKYKLTTKRYTIV